MSFSIFISLLRKVFLSFFIYFFETEQQLLMITYIQQQLLVQIDIQFSNIFKFSKYSNLFLRKQYQKVSMILTYMKKRNVCKILSIILSVSHSFYKIAGN